MKRFSLLVLFSITLIGILPACMPDVPTQILETSALLDTDDSDGPYLVYAVVTNDRAPVDVWLVYTSDSWKTVKKQKMERIESGDHQNSVVYQKGISGPFKPETQIEYYILVKDAIEKVTTDPETVLKEAKIDLSKNTQLIPKEKDNTYRFRILP